ncbi:MAG: acyl-CoA desaturase [Lentisphaerales bacterium]|nr:acyl-CoA desaturase [Lentisphaerales bacterium]
MKQLTQKMISWFDSHALEVDEGIEEKVDWFRALPFVVMHLSPLLIYFCGFSWTALIVCLLSYLVRMFAITGFYHRYFSHKTFKTSRFVHTLFAFLGSSSTQRGPLWWASHHRRHHSSSDTERDVHSPVMKSFLFSHMGWFLTKKHFPTEEKHVRDWMKYPELVFINRFDLLSPFLFVLFLYGLGEMFQFLFPQLMTSGGQFVVWGFFVSTVILYHATFTINSLAHRWGTRTFETKDDSRNNRFLAILTLGEGWHNNHHHYPNSVRQGFYKGEWDPTYWILRLMKAFGLVSDMKERVPEKPVPAGNTNADVADA